MTDEKGIKICHGKEIHIFRIDNYPTYSDYVRDWTTLTRKLAKENKMFTADMIYY